jgi:hypothetical protein
MEIIQISRGDFRTNLKNNALMKYIAFAMSHLETCHNTCTKGSTQEVEVHLHNDRFAGVWVKPFAQKTMQHQLITSTQMCAAQAACEAQCFQTFKETIGKDIDNLSFDLDKFLAATILEYNQFFINSDGFISNKGWQEICSKLRSHQHDDKQKNLWMTIISLFHIRSGNSPRVLDYKYIKASDFRINNSKPVSLHFCCKVSKTTASITASTFTLDPVLSNLICGFLQLFGAQSAPSHLCSRSVKQPLT